MSAPRPLRRPLSQRPPNRIAELRTARGWSMAELAKRVSSSRQRIWSLEHGSTRLNEDWLRVLAAAFDVAPAELLNEEDQVYVLDETERALIELCRRLPPELRHRLPAMVMALVEPVAA